MLPSALLLHESLCLYLDEVYALSKMCYQLISSQLLVEINVEYKIILKEKNIQHQFICGIWSEVYLLGCIDPNYRHGKPLKYLMDSSHMIFAMCDRTSLSNVGFNNFPVLHDIKYQGMKNGLRLKVQKVELIPLEIAQRQCVHYTIRPFIEFNHVDTYGPLRRHVSDLMMSSIGYSSMEEMKMPTFYSTQDNPQQPDKYNYDSFDKFLDSLPM